MLSSMKKYYVSWTGKRSLPWMIRPTYRHFLSTYIKFCLSITQLDSPTRAHPLPSH